MNPVPVIVIGHGFTSRLGVIRSVAQAGAEVTVIVLTNGKDENKPIDCFSCHVRRFLFCDRNDMDGLIRMLLEQCTNPWQKPILVPDTDMVAAVIDLHQAELAPYFLFPHIRHEAGAVLKWMDKVRQKQLARSLGMEVAEGCVISMRNGTYEIPESLTYPCFLKPLATVRGGKGGMGKCDSRADVEAKLAYIRRFRSPDEQILLESYKEIVNEYAVVGFSDGESVSIPAVLHLLVVSRRNPGIALQGKVMPVTGFEEILEKFRNMLKTIGFTGLFDIDFYEADGKLYFGELNLRFGGSGYAVTKMGANLPALMVCSLRGEKNLVPVPAVSGSATYVNERMCYDDWNNGFITLEEYRSFLASADIRFLADSSDPEPGKVYDRMFWKQRVAKAVRRLLKRYGK